MNIDIRLIGYLGKIEEENNNPNNYYRIEEIDIRDIDKVNLKYKDIIKKAINKEYKSI